MDQADLEPMLADLSTQITQLESALDSLSTSLSQTVSQLPLLQRAKLNVLTAYAIESILFSYLRLNDQDAKNHPVFNELVRVKQYFAKIKAAEDRASGADQPTTRIDKDAAGRFIKHGLSGNDRFDRERAEKQAAEKQRAWAKAEELLQRSAGNQGTPSASEGVRSAGNVGSDTEKANRRKRKSHKAPKSSNEAFQALLKGPASKADENDASKKRKKDKRPG